MSRRLLRSLPRSPFSTPLSGSARETEERIRNIFNTKRNARPFCFWPWPAHWLCCAGGWCPVSPPRAEAPQT